MTQKSLKPQIGIVGPKELVSFPDLGLFDVPAKVDTGADGSVIWASDITEVDGELHYKLFDKTSRFYTGQELVADKFSVVSIKNSFGQTEFRYKVQHKMMLADRTILVRFTLANRENNSQPILIGRRTLHGKFVVDVASPVNDGPKRLLLMSTFISPNVSNFVKGIEKSTPDLQITHATYDDVQFAFGPHGTMVTLTTTGEDIANFDIVHFKTSGERDITAAMARYVRHRGVKIVDESCLNFAPSSKLYQYVILADENIAIPQSLFMMPHKLAESYEAFETQLSLPFVLKGIHASRGDHNYLIRNEADYQRACKAIVADGVFVIGQAFVPNDGDYRILVMGRRIALVIHRSRGNEDTHLNNTSQGGAAKLVDVGELPTAVQTDSLIAAKVLEHGIAGVDMVEDISTGAWYCFEVNNGPQIASGAFQAEKREAFAKYILTELNK